MGVDFDLTVDTSAVDTLQMLMLLEAPKAMDAAMKEVAEKVKAWRHGLGDQTWQGPGTYNHGGFTWESTGFAESTIQGYVVGHSRPIDPAGVTDQFGRYHGSNAAAVSPDPEVPMGQIVGVLTMTAEYAPAESQSGSTEPTLGGDLEGIQTYETIGSPDQHIRGGVMVTVQGLEAHQDVLVKRVAEELAIRLAA